MPSFPQTGVLYCDDNLSQLAQMPSESVDLIYLDPPFFSNRVYQVIWGDEAEVRSFEDRWEGGIQHYVGWMRERIVELQRVLKPTGSLYLHCDPHASHYLKVMLDEVFGFQRFINELIWQRTATKGDARRRFGAVHDVILAYAKGQESYFKGLQSVHGETYRSRFTLDGGDGRGPYEGAPLDSPNPRPNLTYEYKGYPPPANGWRVSRAVMEQLEADNRLIFPKKRTGRIRRKNYLRELKGRPVGDVWTDISPINSQAAERLGYPTQKPEALLDRILRASSRPGDVVLDPFCGCGTTIAVAERLERQWIGIDISPTAMEIMRRRLLKQTSGLCKPKIIGAPTTVADLKNLKPFEFQNWVVNQINGTHSPRKSGDMGIDGYWFLTREPVQVKQSEKVGRNVIDNFETAIRRADQDSGYVIAFSFTKDAREEVARARWHDNLNIKLITVNQLLQPIEKRPVDLGPKPESVVDLPLPAMRKAEDLPSAEELVASDKSVEAG